MKKSKYDIIDHTESHILSETECEVVSWFRMLPRAKQRVVSQMLFWTVMDLLSKKKRKTTLSCE